MHIARYLVSCFRTFEQEELQCMADPPYHLYYSHINFSPQYEISIYVMYEYEQKKQIMFQHFTKKKNFLNVIQMLMQ